MPPVGLARARSMGPVADAVARAGGCMARVFARADLPLRLIDHPDRLIPLRDHFTLVECAVRESGDETMPVWSYHVDDPADFGRHTNELLALAAAGTDFRSDTAQVGCDEARAMSADALPITAIAAELGFANPAHFTRAFRSWTGQSPRDWRKGKDVLF
jgi:hypothetical protein